MNESSASAISVLLFLAGLVVSLIGLVGLVKPAAVKLPSRVLSVPLLTAVLVFLGLAMIVDPGDLDPRTTRSAGLTLVLLWAFVVATSWWLWRRSLRRTSKPRSPQVTQPALRPSTAATNRDPASPIHRAAAPLAPSSEISLDPADLEVAATGKGRSARFTAEIPAICSCGTKFHLSAFNLGEGAGISCPGCGGKRTIDPALALELRDTLEIDLSIEVDELGIDTDDDRELEFVLNHGRFPKRGELHSEPKGYPVGIVGESKYQKEIGRCRAGERVELMHEPDNPYSKNCDAIAVQSVRGRTIGYISEESWLKRVLLSESKGCESTILSIERGPRNLMGVVLDVTLQPKGQRIRTRKFTRQ